MKSNDRDLMNEISASGYDSADDTRERVDVFGDGIGSEGVNAPRRLPDVITERIGDFGDYTDCCGCNKKEHNTSPLLTFIMVLLLTTAMTVGAYINAAGLGSEPRETLGSLAGLFIFGAKNTEAPAETAPHGNSGTSIRAGENDVTQGPELGIETPKVTADDETRDTLQDHGEDYTAVTATEGRNIELFIDLAQSGILPAALSSELGAEVLEILRGGSVIVTCAHPSECFSDGIPVPHAAEALLQALTAAGIDAQICNGEFDSSGRIGSYSRAYTALCEMAAGNDVALVIDLHAGGAPGMLVGWGAEGVARKNVALADMINGELGSYACTLTVDSGSFNQNAPWLSLHIELDSATPSSRGMLTARIFADAVIRSIKAART